MFWYQITEYLK